MTIPILRGHDHDHPIGFVEAMSNGSFRFHFAAEVKVTRPMFEEIFGNVGYRITKQDLEGDTIIIREGEILEFSL